ncbi:hypothetical protein CH330_02730 [candidate division WOR-3 bacterium JGI_Cruoil_03_51_56]|uniref:Hemolysin n=1 Tax=candidate division WOR-3 bacterium JGI_Cruoil_03_51_56 TaxID=1973747 RepID=A0A235BW75_UNCW3|nr:MAG: hypothetical protein CH330_02730 [candidate division WOR-3 bacterium JGI_Cruoil_03_51_56]
MELIAGLVLILASGFFSGSETAVYQAQWIRLATWSYHRLSGAKMALRLLNRQELTVITTLVGTNLCNVFATMFFSSFLAIRFGPAYAGFAIITVVILTLLFGEFLPKSFAQAGPNRWLRYSSVPLATSFALFAPVTLVLEGIARLFATPFARSSAKLSLTRQDFLSAMRQRERSNGQYYKHVPSPGQSISNMVARLFRFSGMKVEEAAIPIEQVKSVPCQAVLKDILMVIEEHGFSRIPVYQGEKTNITGVIFAKDLLASWRPNIRPIQKVAEGARVMEVLEKMKHRGEHIAVVTDESNRVTGIVTLEDILEELVGEIRSED